MNRFKKLFTVLLASSFVLSVCSCAKSDSGSGHHKNSDPSKPMYGGDVVTDPVIPDVTALPTSTQTPSDDITYFTMYTVLTGFEKNANNEIKQLIAEKTGVSVEESYITNITPNEAVDMIVASGDYPDYIFAGNYSSFLYENGCLIAWDDYLEMYPNLKALYTDEEWDRFRQDDGHIYWANIYERVKNTDTAPVHNGLAFWIQVRVLEWANYPEIRTLDEYFALLEAYAAANPEMPDGTEVIPYTCLCDNWRNFSIEAAPMMLDGYPNNGCVIVNVDDGVDKPKVVDYNTTDTAKAYFAKLNEEYYKGILDPDFAVQNYDEYINKLCTGRVLGMCDQCWDFQYNVEPAFRVSYSLNDGTDASLSDYGCDYVPLGLVIDGKLDQQYHTYGEMIDYSSGIAVTVGCYDPDKAFGFLNDLLSQDIHDLRFWGIEGVDYLVDKNGLYYRTPEMTEKWNDYSYMAAHTCEYSYMPSWKGMSDDGKNCMIPSEQPSIFREQLSDPVNKCFDAYGVENYVEFIGSKYVKPEPWYPMWSWSNNLDSSSVVGRAFMQMGECKKQWIPKLVLSANFEATWSDYMNVYTVTNPDLFLDAAQTEVEYRLNN